MSNTSVPDSRNYQRGDFSITTYIVENFDNLSDSKTQNGLLIAYYQEVLVQAKKGYFFAQVVSVIGLAFLILAVVFVLLELPGNAPIISLVAGALIEFLAAINFVLFGKTSQQFYFFHERLNSSQRFQMISNMIDEMSREEDKEARLELIRLMGNFNVPVEVGKDDNH